MPEPPWQEELEPGDVDSGLMVGCAIVGGILVLTLVVFLLTSGALVF